jgi:hypothetical protein
LAAITTIAENLVSRLDFPYQRRGPTTRRYATARHEDIDAALMFDPGRYIKSESAILVEQELGHAPLVRRAIDIQLGNAVCPHIPARQE